MRVYVCLLRDESKFIKLSLFFLSISRLINFIFRCASMNGRVYVKKKKEYKSILLIIVYYLKHDLPPYYYTVHDEKGERKNISLVLILCYFFLRCVN